MKLVNNIPYSEEFQDHYYSTQDGLAETRLNFLHGNKLPERWKDTDLFRIAETGFGTGLNFLATMHEWRKTPAGRLEYYSVEKNLLSSDDIFQAMKIFPEIIPELNLLLKAYPNGGQVVDNVFMHILVGDVAKEIHNIPGDIDAWYLDGFAPSRNPAMWSEEIMHQVGVKTKAGGTAATFTVAGFVRRNLKAADLEVRKMPGYGTKRQRLEAVKL